MDKFLNDWVAFMGKRVCSYLTEKGLGDLYGHIEELAHANEALVGIEEVNRYNGMPQLKYLSNLLNYALDEICRRQQGDIPRDDLFLEMYSYLYKTE